MSTSPSPVGEVLRQRRGHHGPSRLEPFRAAGFAVACVLTALAAAAAPSAEAPAPRHRVVVERKPSVLEQRLRAAGGQGCRVVAATAGAAGLTRVGELRVHLDCSGAQALEHRIVSGPLSGALERELDRAAAEGFRVVGAGMLLLEQPNPLGGRERGPGESVVLLLERDGRGPPDEYRLLSPGKPKQFAREVGRLAAEGFRLTGVRGSRGGWLLVLLSRPVVEQPPAAPEPSADPPYLALQEHDRRALFEAVGRAASRGYRVVATAHRGFAGRGDVVVLERAAAPGRPYSYFFLGRPGSDELEARLDEGAAARYRFVPGLDPRVELIVERPPTGSVAAAYRTVEASSSAALEQAVAAATEDGFVFAGLYGGTVVLERAEPAASYQR